MSATLERIAPAQESPSAPRGRLTIHELMMAPALILLGVLSIIPLITLIAMSFSRVRLLGGVRLEWVGLDNWTRALTDADLWQGWALTLFFFAVTLTIEMVLGIAIAAVLSRLVRGRGPLLVIVLLPMFVAPAIVGLLGRYLTDPTFGLYAWVLQGIGIDHDILGNPRSALAAVILMDVWEWTPLIALITLAGMTSVNPSILEAAALDGAGAWRSLWHVVLPSIMNVITVALLIRSMDVVRYFDIISVTTNGGPADATKIMPLRLYEASFRFFDLGYAAVIGLMMLVLTIIIARLFIRVLSTKGQNA